MKKLTKAVRVKVEESESVRQKLISLSALDKSRKLLKKDGFIEIPVTEYFNTDEFTLVDQDNPEYYLQEKTVFKDLDFPDNENKLLPRGWQILGDIIIVTLDEKLKDRKSDIGKALLSYYPGCKTVLLDRGISGQLRQPDREIIAGEDNTETIHKENSCLFKLDAMKIMFSQGNLAEKKRMSKLGTDETVVDMFAGIGYFSIPMAVNSKPKKIISIEINPVSFGYLKENIVLNRVVEIIEPLAGDCAKVTPRHIANRVIMGYFDGQDYLGTGINALLPGGILHYHEAVPEAIESRPVDRIFEVSKSLGRQVEITERRRIKKYAPGVWHVVVDARVE
ncbi:MAG: class I SAM-dependent methyltransferase family protein [Candidatus Methanoperedens sp.]|nr:class I SAM-dependent methyltransferase family protein [Candidatus Methanoperedens sp.]